MVLNYNCMCRVQTETGLIPEIFKRPEKFKKISAELILVRVKS